MNILIDTHIALWAVVASPRLSPKGVDLLLDSGNRVYLSHATLWEIAIKHALAREAMPLSSHEAQTLFEQSGFLLTPISAAAIHATAYLPWHHRDPFDRLLIAEAKVNAWHLLTHDQSMDLYREELAVIRV
jgi:PIN domain nuclease of toxin-antitoxin system